MSTPQPAATITWLGASNDPIKSSPVAATTTVAAMEVDDDLYAPILLTPEMVLKKITSFKAKADGLIAEGNVLKKSLATQEALFSSCTDPVAQHAAIQPFLSQLPNLKTKFEALKEEENIYFNTQVMISAEDDVMSAYDSPRDDFLGVIGNYVKDKELHPALAQTRAKKAVEAAELKAKEEAELAAANKAKEEQEKKKAQEEQAAKEATEKKAKEKEAAAAIEKKAKEAAADTTAKKAAPTPTTATTATSATASSTAAPSKSAPAPPKPAPSSEIADLATKVASQVTLPSPLNKPLPQQLISPQAGGFTNEWANRQFGILEACIGTSNQKVLEKLEANEATMKAMMDLITKLTGVKRSHEEVAPPAAAAKEKEPSSKKQKTTDAAGSKK